MEKIQKRFDQFTIRQFNLWLELIQDPSADPIALFELFGINFTTVKATEYKSLLDAICTVKPSQVKPTKWYWINGTKYRATLDPFKYTAAQFIDLQWTMANGQKLNQILSVILIPGKKSLTGWKFPKYGDGYDPLKVQEDLLDFKIVWAQALSSFFLNQSVGLLKVTKEYSENQLIMMKNPDIKRNLYWRLLNGFNQLRRLQK